MNPSQRLSIRPFAVAATALAASSLLVGQAWAGGIAIGNSYSLTLSGNAPDVVVTNSPTNITGRLALFDAGSADPLSFIVMQGDLLTATINITNGPFTVPASTDQFFGLDFAVGSVPLFQIAGPPVVSGSFNFKLGGVQVGSTVSGNCGNCASLIAGNFPGAAFSFDSVEVNMSFDNLTDPLLLVSADFTYQLANPVPEPATWALWAGGLGALSAWTRKRRRTALN